MEKEFDEIYNRSYQFTLRYVLAKIDNVSHTEDIMQNIYLKLYQVIMSKGIIYIENEHRFLIKLARNELFKYYSLKEKMKSVLIDDYNKFDALIPLNQHHDSELEINNKIDVKTIWEIISTESQDVQKIMSLYYLSNDTIEDIATLLNQNPNTVKSKLYRTVARIRQSYGGVHNE
ncbi:MAG: sigma-70 family RNA polymerase sigma factor [Bacilli bacterium]